MRTERVWICVWVLYTLLINFSMGDEEIVVLDDVELNTKDPDEAEKWARRLTSNDSLPTSYNELNTSTVTLYTGPSTTPSHATERTNTPKNVYSEYWYLYLIFGIVSVLMIVSIIGVVCWKKRKHAKEESDAESQDLEEGDSEPDEVNEEKPNDQQKTTGASNEKPNNATSKDAAQGDKVQSNVEKASEVQSNVEEKASEVQTN